MIRLFFDCILFLFFFVVRRPVSRGSFLALTMVNDAHALSDDAWCIIYDFCEGGALLRTSHRLRCLLMTRWMRFDVAVPAAQSSVSAFFFVFLFSEIRETSFRVVLYFFLSSTILSTVSASPEPSALRHWRAWRVATASR